MDISPLAVDEPNESDYFNIYPNPVNEFINIESSGNRYGKIQIFSMLGARVLETDFRNKINVGNLSGGVYYMTIISGKRAIVKMFNVAR